MILALISKRQMHSPTKTTYNTAKAVELDRGQGATPLYKF